MSLAKNKLQAADYGSLTKLLPNTEKYVNMAQQAGILTDPITDVTRLNSAMGKLGITPDTASKMISQIGDYVGSVGGDSAKNKLMSVLK